MQDVDRLDPGYQASFFLFLSYNNDDGDEQQIYKMLPLEYSSFIFKS